MFFSISTLVASPTMASVMFFIFYFFIVAQIVIGRSDHDNTQCVSETGNKGSEQCSDSGGKDKKKGQMKYK